MFWSSVYWKNQVEALRSGRVVFGVPEFLEGATAAPFVAERSKPEGGQPSENLAPRTESTYNNNQPIGDLCELTKKQLRFPSTSERTP
jgi:hypothetical protein